MLERRTRGTRCPKCGQARVERTVTGTSIGLTCSVCGHHWPERRRSMMAGWTGPSDEDVHKAITDVCAARDLDSLLTLTRKAARRLTAADGVSLILRAGESCYYADEDAIAPLWKGQRFPLTKCVSGWVMLNKQSVLIPDIYVDTRVPHDAYRPTFVKSLLMVPVNKEEPVAAIGAYWQIEAAPTQADVALVELLAEAVSIGLKREQTWTRIQDWLRTR